MGIATLGYRGRKPPDYQTNSSRLPNEDRENEENS